MTARTLPSSDPTYNTPPSNTGAPQMRSEAFMIRCPTTPFATSTGFTSPWTFATYSVRPSSTGVATMCPPTETSFGQPSLAAPVARSTATMCPEYDATSSLGFAPLRSTIGVA